MNWDQAKNVLFQNAKLKKAYEDKDIAHYIAKIVIDARIRRGVTQQELAKKIGTSQPSIARLERGDSLPSLRFLVSIFDALEVELNLVLKEKGKK